jgi:hypothetical protein
MAKVSLCRSDVGAVSPARICEIAASTFEPPLPEALAPLPVAMLRLLAPLALAKGPFATLPLLSPLALD